MTNSMRPSSNTRASRGTWILARLVREPGGEDLISKMLGRVILWRGKAGIVSNRT
jgi:hypothetical protein